MDICFCDKDTRILARWDGLRPTGTIPDPSMSLVKIHLYIAQRQKQVKKSIDKIYIFCLLINFRHRFENQTILKNDKKLSTKLSTGTSVQQGRLPSHIIEKLSTGNYYQLALNSYLIIIINYKLVMTNLC